MGAYWLQQTVNYKGVCSSQALMQPLVTICSGRMSQLALCSSGVAWWYVLAAEGCKYTKLK